MHTTPEIDEKVKMKEKEQNMNNKKENEEDCLIIPQQIEDFLTVSHHSTHIIENFVEPQEGNLEIDQINERIMTHEGKIKLYRNKLEKLVENGENDHDIEAMRSSDAECFEDTVITPEKSGSSFAIEKRTKVEIIVLSVQ